MEYKEMRGIKMDKKMQVHFSTGVKYKDMYYLTAIHMNALFMYDEKMDRLTFLTNFKKEEKREYLYLKSFLYKNEAWFIPNQADNIAIVNLDTYCVNYITLNYQKCYDHEGIKYINFLYFNEKFLCLVPWAVDTALIINLQNKHTIAYHDVVNQMGNYQNAIFLNNKIYFFPWRGNSILVLDLKTNERTKLPQKEKEESFGNVVYDRKTEYLFHAPARQNCLLINSLKYNIYRKIKFDCWNDEQYKTFYTTERIDDIFCWGHEKNIVLKVNKKNSITKIYQINSQYFNKSIFPICSNDIEALVYDESCIIKYNEDKDEFSYLQINIDSAVLTQAMKTQCLNFEKRGKKINLQENEAWCLKLFLICISDYAERKNNEIKKNIGNQIYNII